MQTQISEKLGQSGSVFQADQGYNPQISTFDNSKKSALTFSEGMLIPLDVIRCIPNDTHHLSYRWLLDVMPMVVPPQTQYKFIIAAYWCALTDLWKGAETFVTKGRNASINMSIPIAKYWSTYTDDRTTLNLSSDGSSEYILDVPHGLPSYLGLSPTQLTQTAAANDAHSASFLPYASLVGADNSENTDQVGLTGFKHLSGDGVNALIPFMYQKICRTLLPTNLLQDNKIWFPDDISNDDWRIAPDGSNLTADGHFVPLGTTLPSDAEAISNFIPHVGSGTSDDPLENSVNIWQLRSPQYPDDLATTAKPWLVRGSETTINMDVNDVNLGLVDAIDYDAMGAKMAQADGNTWASLSDAQKNVYRQSIGIPFTYVTNDTAYNTNTDGDTVNQTFGQTLGSVVAKWNFTGMNRGMQGYSDKGIGALAANTLGNTRPGIHIGESGASSSMPYNGVLSNYHSTFITLKPGSVANSIGVQVIGTPKASLTANTLRSLIAFSIKDEIDALTNGNYNSTIRAHYGITPKHHDFEPRYIGGSVEYLNFGSVMQTSASTGSQPLGSVAGTGNNSAGCDFGSFHCDDFGYIMVIGYVVPEVTYSTGIDRMWTDIEQEDLWFPEYSALGFQPVLNREVYVSGVQSTDDGLFGYQTRGIEYKQRRNDVKGLFALSPDKDAYFAAYNQARLFGSTPKLSNEFTTACPKNLRRDYLSFPDLPSYRLQLACDVKSTRTLPYKSVPARFGM